MSRGYDLSPALKQVVVRSEKRLARWREKYRAPETKTIKTGARISANIHDIRQDMKDETYER